MRTSLGFLAALALSAASPACGGAAPPRAPDGPAPTGKAAIAEVRGLATEIERSLAHGNATGLAPLCAIDLVALGPRGSDAGRARTDTLIALGDALPGKKHKLKVREQRIESAPGARSAWLTEQLDVDGKRHAITAIAAEVDGLWVITAVMVGASWPERALRGAAPAAPPPLAPPPPAPPGPAGNQPAPPAVLAAFTQAVGDVDARQAQLDGERVVVLGPGERAAWRGVKALAKAWKKRAPRWTLAGDTQAGATPDGEVVWLAASAETIEDAGAGKPRRLFAVYRRDASEWRLVVLHESVAR